MCNENSNTLLFDDCDNFKIIFKILSLDNISSCDDFNSIINLLTNHPDPIREAVAIKLEDYIEKHEKYFLNDFTINKILDSIIDINPNVSRAICNIISKSSKLSRVLENKIINRINDLISDLKKYEKLHNDSFSNFKKITKNHAKNKLIFSLYWYLEALYECLSNRFNEEIIEILKYTINFNNYTIREKTAKILTNLPAPPLELLQKAKSDQNFYVKIQVCDKIINED